MVNAMEMGTAASARGVLYPVVQYPAAPYPALLAPGSGPATGNQDDAFRSNFHQHLGGAHLTGKEAAPVLQDGGKGVQPPRTKIQQDSQSARPEADTDEPDTRALVPGQGGTPPLPVIRPAVDGSVAASGKPVKKSSLSWAAKFAPETATPSNATSQANPAIGAALPVSQPVVPVPSASNLADIQTSNPANIGLPNTSAPLKPHTAEKGCGQNASGACSLAADAEEHAAPQGLQAAEKPAPTPAEAAAIGRVEAGTVVPSQATLPTGMVHLEPFAERSLVSLPVGSAPVGGGLGASGLLLSTGQMLEGSPATIQTIQPTHGMGSLSTSTGLLEMGVQSGAHGWVRVRAELDAATGQVSAVLQTDASHAERLHHELPAISSFLQAEHVQLSSLTVAHADQSGVSAQGGQDPDAGSSRKGRRGTDSAGGGQDALPGALEFEQDPEPLSGQSGGWLNVLA